MAKIAKNGTKNWLYGPADVARPKNFGPKVDQPTTPTIPETIFRICGPFFDVGFTKVENYNIS